MNSRVSTPSDPSVPPVLVTGSAGHVGANLVRRLLADGTRVRVLLRHEDNNEGLEGLGVERSFGDIRDLNATRQAVEGCQGVYHVAAKISTIEGNHARVILFCRVFSSGQRTYPKHWTFPPGTGINPVTRPSDGHTQGGPFRGVGRHHTGER